MSNLIDAIDKLQMREVPQFRVGCTVKVNYKIIEGTKERIQAFEGVVISRYGKDNNARATFTVRKVKGGFGVERIFALHSPKVDSVQVLKVGVVHQANLYYLRERSGKSARLKEQLRRR